MLIVCTAPEPMQGHLCSLYKANTGRPFILSLSVLPIKMPLYAYPIYLLSSYSTVDLPGIGFVQLLLLMI